MLFPELRMKRSNKCGVFDSSMLEDGRVIMHWHQLHCRLKKRAILLLFIVAVGGGGWLFRHQKRAASRFPVVPALCVEALASQGGTAVCPAYQPGERLQYRVSWEKILVAGTAEMSVKNSNNLFEFVLRAQSSAALDTLCNLTDEMTSRYDPVSGFPILYQKKFTLKKRMSARPPNSINLDVQPIGRRWMNLPAI